MQFKNMTPHVVTVVDAEGGVIASFEPSGEIARVATSAEVVENIGGVDIYRVEMGDTNIPDPEEGVGLIVSTMIMTSFPERKDLFAPYGLVRNEEGTVIGCQGLSRN